MGVALSGLAVVAAIVAGAAITAWLEPRVNRLAHAVEPGPAARIARRESRTRTTDRWLCGAAPFVAALGVALATVTIPFGEALVGADVRIGLFYYLVVIDLVVLGVALAGWGANTPNAVEACYRIVAQLVAYVVPLGLAVLGPIMMARSLSVVDIVEAQQRAGLWYVVAQPLGFGLYVATALMQAYRAPFLEPFSQRIDGGILAAVGGWAALLWRLALSGVLFLVAAMGAAIFLGGHAGPWLPGPAWMLLKTFALVALLLWVGRRAPLLSTAQMLALAWKVLIPAGLLNVLAVGGLILLGVGQGPSW